MYLTLGMDETKKLSWDGRHRILLVCDMREILVGGVHIVGERLVTDTRHAVAHSLEGDSRREMERKEYRVQESKRRAEGMADHRHRCARVSRQGLLHCGQYLVCSSVTIKFSIAIRSPKASIDNSLSMLVREATMYLHGRA